MKINLNKLPINIDGFYEIPEDFLINTSIVKLSAIKANGIIKVNSIDEIELNLDVNGEMVLKDAITNELVNYPFSFQIEENLDENIENCAKYFEKSQNTLDIIEILWENIVLEVPISFTNSSGIHLSGKGWELNSDKKDGNIDPRFEKLNELFKGGE